MTISLGVACFPQHGRRAEDLLRAADAALYRAKRSGRDQVVVQEDPGGVLAGPTVAAASPG